MQVSLLLKFQAAPNLIFVSMAGISHSRLQLGGIDYHHME
jgi:hypothetical protein